MKKWTDMIENLSLDVVAGALAGGLMATTVMGVHPGWAWWVCLALGVWVFYTGDHLLDALKSGDKNVSARHSFPLKYRKQIIISLVSLMIVGVFIAIEFLTKEVLLFGISMGVISFLYLIIVWQKASKKNKTITKEAWIAVIYTTGIWGVPLLFGSLSAPLLFLIMLFMTLVFVEGTIAAYYETEADQKENHSSVVLALGKHKSKKILYLLFVMIGIAAAAGGLTTQSPLNVAFAIILLMNVMLFAIFHYQKLFAKGLYHKAGEAVFILPAAMVII
jgi:4-hydroxybenzoate polyprenyltransferase